MTPSALRKLTLYCAIVLGLAGKQALADQNAGYKKATKCYPNGYWNLRLHALKGGTCPQAGKADETLKLLILPSATQRKAENAKGEDASVYEIIDKKAISDEVLVDGACLVTVDSWPNPIEPHEEEYKMTLIEKAGYVSGVATMIGRNSSDPIDIFCIQQFTVTGKRSMQVASVGKPPA